MDQSAVKPSSLAALVSELSELFGEWGKVVRGGCESRDGEFGTVFDDDDFAQLALRIHRMQRATNPTLRRFWDNQGRGAINSWNAIPPVPTSAFRYIPIRAGPVERIFRTSGTTGGAGLRGEHHVASLGLYRAAARGNYRAHLFVGSDPVHVVSLTPSPEHTPDSSLATMAGFIAQEPEVLSTTWAFTSSLGVDIQVVQKAVAMATEPVLLLTTAFALVQLLDGLGNDRMGLGRRLRLPPGSRVMETGGFKGRVAEVDRAALYQRVEDQLGVVPSNIVNEYGMTELLSQAYDGVAGRALPVTERLHRFPPWVRVRALHPTTLTPLPAGEPGLLAHFDLANAASVCHILTEDLGETTADGGFRLLGRAAGADLRGCSLTAEAFLRAKDRPGAGGGQ